MLTFDAPPGEIELVLFSDLHVGDKRFDENKFNHYAEWILENPNRFCLFNGDLLNNGIKSSVSDVYQEVITPGEQPVYAAKLIAPLAERTICITKGNHEHRTKKESDQNITETLALNLYKLTNVDIPIVDEGDFIRFRWGKRHNSKPWSAALYVTHGAGGGATVGSVANMLSKIGNGILARIYIASHRHIELAYTDQLVMPDLRNKKEKRAERLFVCTKSFLEWGGYAKRGLMPARGTGAPVITFAEDGRIWCNVGQYVTK